jgi:hypothetical protein
MEGWRDFQRKGKRHVNDFVGFFFFLKAKAVESATD